MAYVNALLGALPNWCATAGAVITAGSEAAGNPASNLRLTSDSELGDLWRSAGISPVADTILEIDLGQPRPVTSAYLVRHNARPGDTWRLRGSSAPIPTPAAVAPSTVTPMAGTVTGTAANIDDPVDDPTGDVVSLDGPSRVRFSFPSPGTLAGGPASQLVRLRVLSRDATPNTPKAWAVSVVTKLEQGPLPAELSEIASGSLDHGSEVVLELPFASDLPPAGTIHVEVETLGSGVLEIVAAELRPETDGYQTPLDTGYSPLVLEPQSALRYLLADPVPEELLRQTTALHAITDGQLVEHTYRYWRVDLRSPGHPSGYVGAAALALGPSIEVDATADIEVRPVDHSITVRTPSGDAYTRMMGSHTEARVPIDLRSAEGPRELLALRRYMGEGGRFGVSLLPEEVGAPALSFWGHLRGGGGLGHEPGQFWDDDRGFYWTDTLELAEV